MHIPKIPTIVTLLRIGTLPFFVIVFYSQTAWARTAATFVFLFAAFTDWLDGYLARRLEQTSPFGAFLDPVADKVMVAVVLVVLVSDMPGPLTAIPAAVIIGREIVISALREWMAEFGKRAHVTVNVIGKLKTLTQMIAITLLVYAAPIGPVPTTSLGIILLYVAMILTLLSMTIYLYMAWNSLNQDS